MHDFHFASPRSVHYIRQSLEPGLRRATARTGQLLNLADIARDLGVAVNTIRAWLSVLEATWQVFVLRPYHANIGKRLVKTPKVYFTDVGTLCHLAGLRDPEHAASGPLGGVILETAVLSEIVKSLAHRAMPPQVFFWRTLAGTEVDIVVDTGGKLVPIEVKLSATPPAGHGQGHPNVAERLEGRSGRRVRGPSGRRPSAARSGRDGVTVRRPVTVTS